jgi:amino-acid N-acetyltransferase
MPESHAPPRPPAPEGPIVSLSLRVLPERRDAFLALLAEAFPFYEAPGGVRMSLFESVDEPGRMLELVSYAGEAEYLADQERVEHDPEMRAMLGRWRALVEGPVEVRRMRPVAIGAPSPAGAGAPSIEEAAFTDHAAVAALLEARGLPVPGPDDAPVRLLVARHDGAVIGCVGWERYGEHALLRSLAVATAHERRGLGVRLVRELTRRLGGAGVREVVLLTEGARPFFEKLGFEVAPRPGPDDAVAPSRELSLPCCASAVFMRRRLRL